jgi:urea transporter
MASAVEAMMASVHMKPPVDYLFSPVDVDAVPYWRLVLRGCSQLCFQSNELTGLLFLAAVFVASPISAAYLLVAGIMAPAGRMLFGEPKDIVASGLPGLNPGLVALALPAFFHTGWSNVGMWGVLVASIVVTSLLVSLLLTFVPFPISAFPFLLVFWMLCALAPQLDFLQPITHTPVDFTFHPLVAVLHSLGQALFSSSIWSGVLFLIGVLLSNWRHGVIALMGAVIGTLVSYYYRDVDAGSVNLGLYGFNGVLSAVSVFVICGGQLRLAILGALIATILTPAIADLGLLTLAAPFVFTVWLMLALGWAGEHWFDEPPAHVAAADAATQPSHSYRGE